MAKKIIIVIIILAAAVLGWLGYMGMLSTPAVTERETGPYTFAYEEFTGPYKDTGPVFDRVYKALKEKGVSTTLGLGVYFDDPAKVPEDKLRSRCGVVIEGKDMGKLTEIRKMFKVGTMERRARAVCEFPIRGMMSYMFGPMKCYPAMMKYLEAKGYAFGKDCFEVYDEQGKKIIFNMDFVKK